MRWEPCVRTVCCKSDTTPVSAASSARRTCIIVLIVSTGNITECSATPASEPAIAWLRKEPLSGDHSSVSKSS